MKNEGRKNKDFSIYDVIFHVAGITHILSNKNMEELYYKINRDLAIKTAKKSKTGGSKAVYFYEQYYCSIWR